ncbi:MAG: nucleotidyltransferase family protein [Bacteroidales bacterium]|jgi:NDP-sugar pyrophosphorylase family protein|nr:nucleotidyltransferase family protein [Bacteroidales bacterium]
MKAMIFAAGLGTRLKQLTQHRPKALVEVNGKPLLLHVIEKLKQAGVDNLIVNLHHYPQQIVDFVRNNDWGVNICFSLEEDKLLDTGGGLKKAASFFDDGKPFFIHNVDVISDVDLQEMYHYHLKKNALATLAVRNRDTQRYFLFNENLCLCGRENKQINQRIVFPDISTETKLFPLAFSGIHVVSPQIFEFFPEEEVFPIIDLYTRKHSRVFAFLHNYGNWKDMGKVEDFLL